MSMISFSKEKVKALAAEGLTVPEMAKELNADVSELEAFYAECYKGNQDAFPIRLLITKKWLEEKLENMPAYKIAKVAGCSAGLVRRLMEIYGLKAKPKLVDLLTPEVLYSLYVEEHLQDKDIAAKFGCSAETVKKIRTRHSIGYETRKEAQAEMSIKFFHHLYVELGFSPKYIARMLNCPIYRIKTMRTEYANSDHPLAKEIADTKRFKHTYANLIELLMKNVEPEVLLEHLREHTIAEVAEMYHLIPAAEPGVATFTKEWLEIVLHRMNVSQVIETYHIGKTFINDMMKENDLAPVPLMERIDEKTVRSLFIDNEWDDEKIASVLGTTKNAIVLFRKEKGIKISQRKKFGDRLTLEKFRTLYLEEKASVAQIAAIYDVPLSIVKDLRKKYAEIDSEIASHMPRGVSEERLAYLKKQVKFEGMKK